MTFIQGARSSRFRWLVALFVAIVAIQFCFSEFLWERASTSVDRFAPNPGPSSASARLALASLSWLAPSHRKKAWALFYHLGGNGPWIPKRYRVLDVELEPPNGCYVDQAHMLSRHAERYPTKHAGARHFALLYRFEAAPKPMRGSLSFVNKWTYFTNTGDPDFEDLTSTGPYAGTKQAFRTGSWLRKRYKHLIPPKSTTKLWSCGSPRDVATAKHFATGFFGSKWERDAIAELVVIPETFERGGDTLTPGHTCLNYKKDEEFGHDYGYHQLAIWQANFSKPIAARLSAENDGFEFSSLEIYSMMEMCGFEIMVRGASPWCNVFTRQEWVEFEYARDLLHFYRAGPGNMYAGAMGWLWLNATANLLSQPETGGLYFSFVHDGDIIPMVAALDLYGASSGKTFHPECSHLWNMGTDGGHLPADHLKEDRSWRTSDLVPMGGRVILERLKCQSSLEDGKYDDYVRLIINDGVTEVNKKWESTQHPGLVPQNLFVDFIARRGSQVGAFREVCGLNESVADRITFLHQ